MKVLTLQCAQRHSFEGWFASEDDFLNQLKRALIECPMCADKSIQKLPSAPRLNFGAQQAPALPKTHTVGTPGDKSPELDVSPMLQDLSVGQMPASVAAQAAFLKGLRHLMAKTEDVGERFADEARRIHYGEIEGRAIRGQASIRETVELMEEGIQVMPLPMLPALKETLQ